MKYIAYYRKSKGGNLTQEQLRRSLGIESQKMIVRGFLKEGDELVGEYEDMETGKEGVYRPELHKAFNECSRLDATLLIAKLDRLSRSVTFISALTDKGIKFKCADMPDMDNFTIHIFAALAQKEREQISSRVKNALAVKKKEIEANGGYTDRHGEWRTKLGNSNHLTKEGLKKAHQVNRMKALENPNNIRAKSFAKVLKESGATLQKIADTLNDGGFRASSGGMFKAEQVRRLLL